MALGNLRRDSVDIDVFPFLDIFLGYFPFPLKRIMIMCVWEKTNILSLINLSPYANVPTFVVKAFKFLMFTSWPLQKCIVLPVSQNKRLPQMKLLKVSRCYIPLPIRNGPRVINKPAKTRCSGGILLYSGVGCILPYLDFCNVYIWRLYGVYWSYISDFVSHRCSGCHRWRPLMGTV